MADRTKLQRDLEFKEIVLAHTLKVADKSEGQSRQLMLEQADRIRVQISDIRQKMAELPLTSEDKKFLNKVSKAYAKKKKVKKRK